MQKLSIVLGALLMSFAPAFASQAAIVYDNGIPDRITGYEMSSAIMAEDFTLPTVQSFNQVTFWAFGKSGSYTGTVSYWIYDDNEGLPGNILASGSLPVPAIATGRTFMGTYPELVLTFDIPTFNAAAATKYHLGLHNGTLDQKTNLGFYWMSAAANSSDKGEQWYLSSSEPSWITNSTQIAFQLLEAETVSAVPIPGALLLFASGLGTVLVGRRTRSRK